MAATGTAVGLTNTPADAQPPFPGRHEPHGPGFPDRDRHDYVVLVRHHGHWDRYRVFDDRHDAQRAARRLERQDARIEVIHRHR